MKRVCGLKRSEEPKAISWKEKSYEIFFKRSWWVFLFVALCYLLYSQGMQKKVFTYRELKFRFDHLSHYRQLALQEREDLFLQVQSQHDPAWIEMALMKSLGLVPEGETKIY
ncbi:MAG: hypothetical protein A2Y28_05545, partial [Chlamydiae bacterium GWC2_50_10]